jgi:hypothetical protein
MTYTACFSGGGWSNLILLYEPEYLLDCVAIAGEWPGKWICRPVVASQPNTTKQEIISMIWENIGKIPIHKQRLVKRPLKYLQTFGLPTCAQICQSSNRVVETCGLRQINEIPQHISIPSPPSLIVASNETTDKRSHNHQTINEP